MAGPQQKPETFLLSAEAESALPQQTQHALQQVDNLKFFLATAPVEWPSDHFIKRYPLPTGEVIACVLWNNLFHISGTDIVRCLAFRFQAFGRPVKNSKKFEEGIFSDLRNLKAGTDASLEEPKSPFLDFLFKNNCIRTQKKQKVFFWYSVPHDRLFLDALERDLKREKAGQETTTSAEREPALSFEFDASQTLFEQLTKAQQANSSSFDASQQTHSGSASPSTRAATSMPPPSMVPPAVHHVPKEALNDMSYYSQTTIPVAASTPMMTNPLMMTAPTIKREQYYGQIPFDRSGVPFTQITQRHSSMPTYMEYSPAPSFMSGQTYYDDYSTTRGISYEPQTPPQQLLPYNSEPAYLPADDASYYTPMNEIQQTYGNFMPSSTMNTPQYGPIQTSIPRQHQLNTVQSHVEGSPTYKQRRRGSPLAAGYAAAAALNPIIPTSFMRTPHAVRRPSDLRRSVSASVAQPDVSIGPRATSGEMRPLSLTPAVSRGGTPLPTTEHHQQSRHHQQVQQQKLHPQQQQNQQQLLSPQTHSIMRQRYASHVNDAYGGGQAYAYAAPQSIAGPFRRARSATTVELGPYPQKAHSCPIPTCGRQFKRLEHLKRHVRTHTQERNYVCPVCRKAFSRSDNLAQHRRTHETDADGNPLATSDDDEDDEEDGTRSNAEDDSADILSNTYLAGQQSMLSSVAGVHDLSLRDSVSGTPEAMVMMGSMSGSMGPPPLPMTAHGY